jgi:chromate reductase
MTLLIVSGSIRRDSLNTRLAHLLAASGPIGETTVEHGLGRLPFYDGDLEAAGIPAAVEALRIAVAAAAAVVIVTPEYNGTVPGVLGNAIDWLSRPAGHSVLRDKPVVVCSASPTRFGGVRAAEHLRTVLARVGARVTAGPAVATAHERLDVAGLGNELGRQLVSALADVLGDEHAAVPA